MRPRFYECVNLSYNLPIVKTSLIHHPTCEKHDTGVGHPESPMRYRAILDALQEDVELWNTLDVIEPKEAPKGLIQAAHDPAHYKRVERAFGEGMMALDADTTISFRSFDAAMLAAGGAIAAVDNVLSGKSDNAFVVSRPPGHHATTEHSMGFCIFNNAAIACKHAQNSYKDVDRVAIIDWDVHHGNGTQGIFYSDPSVFFLSLHQYPWYPGTGSRGETGQGRGLGSNMNVPLKANTPAVEHIRMFEAAIGDLAAKFRPDLIIISAGFDAHLNDPLGQLKLEDDDFSAMTHVVKEWADQACDGRIVSLLEGGYDINTLGATVRSHVAALKR